MAHTKTEQALIKATQVHILYSSPDQIGVHEEAPQVVLKMFHIYHSVNPITRFTEAENQLREYVGFVMATDMEHAYKMAQNDFNSDYQKYKVRSTSVGDLIQDNYGFYMVCDKGFKLICLVDETGE
jgi:hypothetical protein